MKKQRMQYYRTKLQNERNRVEELIKLMRKNETIDSRSEIASELSFYDNHPADLASEISDIERGTAFKRNEESILKKIDSALESIKTGNYGICKKCGVEINEERLEFIPYAEYCTKCQNERNSIKPREINDRPVEEEVLDYQFGEGKSAFGISNSDRDDSYMEVANFNKIDNVVEFYDNDGDEDYIDYIEKISNEQYKNQLPD